MPFFEQLDRAVGGIGAKNRLIHDILDHARDGLSSR